MEKRLEAQPEAQATELAAINQVTLTPLVRSALNSETIEIATWSYEQLHGGVGAGTAVYRFAGQGSNQGQTVPWSLILKVLQPLADNSNISDWNYYKREVEAYRSGWLADLPGSLTAPRNFDTIEHADGRCWIWLEDVTDEIGSSWPLAHYGVVARHLGQFNGAYLTGQPQPSWSWLSSGWLRSWVASETSAITPLRHSLAQPLVRRWLPDDSSDQLFRLWAERDLFLDSLDQLPQTICHLDAFRRNLFARQTADGADQTVAIDWEDAGRGAIGQEIAPLTVASLFFFEVELVKAQELDGIVFAGYLEGLHDVGWQGDPRQVRLGYTADASMRYRCGMIGRVLTMIQDESRHALMQQAFGSPIEEVLDHFAQVGRFVASLTDETRELLDILE
jgi:hypothetical protein